MPVRLEPHPTVSAEAFASELSALLQVTLSSMQIAGYAKGYGALRSQGTYPVRVWSCPGSFGELVLEDPPRIGVTLRGLMHDRKPSPYSSLSPRRMDGSHTDIFPFNSSGGGAGGGGAG